MIRTEAEYRAALRSIQGERDGLAAHEAKLAGMGLSSDQVARGMAPLRTLHQTTSEEVQEYERVKRGDLGGFVALRDVGRLLIAARLATGLSQRKLAEALGVDESQVSRDERGEYGGVTLERACDVLDALGVEVRIACRVRAAGESTSRGVRGRTRAQRQARDGRSEALSPPPIRSPRRDPRRPGGAAKDGKD